MDCPGLSLRCKPLGREERYSSVEKELLKRAVDALHYFSVHTPHLQWLHRKKDSNAWITQWCQLFNFRVVHRPGPQMVGAQFLSHHIYLMYYWESF